jgi:hypothetical protein
MSTDQLRCLVASAYAAESWRKRVARMTDGQVLAIYRSLQRQKKVK